MTQTCICCGGTTITDHLRGLKRCTACTHVWADMDLSDEALRALYAEGYFQGEEYLDYEKEAPALQRNFRARLREIHARHPGGGSLWEIGTAYGLFLREAQAQFSAAGCDISEHAVSQARARYGVDARCMDYLRDEAPDAQDVVCLWDTIEHLREPHAFLARAVDQLRDGGTLALSTGDIGSLMARTRGAKWRLIHPPTHLHYFSARSITVLLHRLGFGDVEVHYRAFWRSADAVAFRLFAHPPGKVTAPLYRVLCGAGLLHFAFPMNTFDLMTVYARKLGAARVQHRGSL
ncbi:MAG: class I SAM-dependent methyltransferase [Candidatus Hydrogenedentes bacterium]|nr:class I SAM-dependent methyltransferase [Candidatus Hydrogenedentota bacterium]